MYNNELMHYGRKGMKWGQHIYTDENGNPIGQGDKSRKELRAERKAERKAAIDTGKEWCERVPMLMDPLDFYEIM